jgi:hypothetical protein
MLATAPVTDSNLFSFIHLFDLFNFIVLAGGGGGGTHGLVLSMIVAAAYKRSEE